MQVIADLLDIHPVEVHSVVSFYSFLDERPQGQFVIRLCRTTTCDMAGKEHVARQLAERPADRLRPDHARRQVFAGLGELPGDVRSGAGDVGQRADLHARHAGESPRHSGRVPADVRRPRDDLAQGATEYDASPSTTTNQLTFSTIEPGSGSAMRPWPAAGRRLAQVAASGLRGRGGAGFPTSLKWELAAKSPGETKYVVCNADEGEPGTFKDRVILAEFADLVFEGMTIGAGSSARSTGSSICGPNTPISARIWRPCCSAAATQGCWDPPWPARRDFAFDIAIRMGSGAYVCGEETALIESLEGQRGEPRNRPPFPIDTGFLGNPDDRQQRRNLRLGDLHPGEGADWFKSIGTREIDRPQAVQRFRRLRPARRV